MMVKKEGGDARPGELKGERCNRRNEEDETMCWAVTKTKRIVAIF